MSKHYIRLDGIYVVKSFSDAFEQPTEDDIFIEEGGRHYNLPLRLDDGCPKYKGKLIDLSEQEQQAWRDINIIPPVDYDAALVDAISKATTIAGLKQALIGGIGKTKIKGRKK